MRNPPRPCASKRVDALNQAMNPPNPKTSKQAHKGEGLPSPYPLPDAPAHSAIILAGTLVALFTLQKVVVKPILFQNVRFLAPSAALIYPSHLPSDLFWLHFSLSDDFLHDFFSFCFHDFSENVFPARIGERIKASKPRSLEASSCLGGNREAKSI